MMPSQQNRQRQQGAVLLIVMVILSLLTLLTIHAVNDSVLNEKLVNNAQDSSVAFQAAEAVLKDARFLLNHLQDRPVNAEGIPTLRGIFTANTAPTQVGSEAWIAASRVFGEGTHQGSLNFGREDANYISAQPRYIIEELPEIGFDPITNIATYKITALATGGNDNTRVVLEEIYRQPFNNVLSITASNGLFNFLLLAPSTGFSQCFSLNFDRNANSNCGGFFPRFLRPPFQDRPVTVDIRFSGFMNGVFSGDFSTGSSTRGVIDTVLGLFQGLFGGLIDQGTSLCTGAPIPEFLRTFCSGAGDLGNTVVDAGINFGGRLADFLVPEGFTVAQLNMDFTNSFGNFAFVFGGDTRNICVQADGRIFNMAFGVDFSSGVGFSDLFSNLAAQVFPFGGEIVGTFAGLFEGILGGFINIADGFFGSNFGDFFSIISGMDGDDSDSVDNLYQIMLGHRGSLFNFFGFFDAGGNDTYRVSTGQISNLVGAPSPLSADFVMLMDLQGTDSYRVNAHEGAVNIVMLLDCTPENNEEVFQALGGELGAIFGLFSDLRDDVLNMPQEPGAEERPEGFLSEVIVAITNVINPYIACPGVFPLFRPFEIFDWFRGFFPRAVSEVFSERATIATPNCVGRPERISWRQVF